MKLHRHRAAAIGERHFLHHQAQVAAGLEYREIAALFALPRHPAEKFDRAWIVAGAYGILHVRIGTRLVQLMVEGGDNVFPRLVEGHDTVVPAVAHPLGVNADRVVERHRGVDVHRAVIAAQPVQRVVIALRLDRVVGTAALLPTLSYNRIIARSPVPYAASPSDRIPGLSWTLLSRRNSRRLLVFAGMTKFVGSENGEQSSRPISLLMQP